MTEKPPVQSKGRLSGTYGLSRTEILILAALVVALFARFLARPGAPFWLDEAATGAIISQPNLGSFWQEVRWEMSSPLYFIFMRVWQDVFGISNFALRAPSIIFSIAAPLCILFAHVPRMTRFDRLSWAALLALWVPGIGYAQDARCYALVLLLSTVQTLAYIRLLETTSIRNCALWVLASGLVIAAHYDAAMLALFQGIIFIGLRPREAVKCLPTGLIIIPTVALFLWQFPEIAHFMKPDTTWYKNLTPYYALIAGFYLIGWWLWIIALPVLLVAAVIAGRRYHSKPEIAKTLVWTATASVLAAATLIIIAIYRPILTLRYLAPFAPGVLLSLIVIMHIIVRDGAPRFVSRLVGYSSGILLVWLALGAHHVDSVVETLNYENASREIMHAGIRHVVFAWDNPNARVMHPEQIKEFGNFFFKRAGYQADIIPFKIGKNENPNERLLDAAKPTHAAIIWLYDTSVNGTAAKRFPPDISQLDNGWQCHDRRKAKIGVVTCLPSGNSSMVSLHG